ncbi:hypothetical protein BU25DRAFT_11563 [Macroventuria anomochaeta]|uniref:Uncharacterized protein n=1 Tax=Macroventuria anomochaeta TaxID=301207 RepID=A0ACB6SI87_9PLEO|nr:uncharacterized protein BU25DRAFT_11563 [Macroventuria anomochaeta]KAF2633708.1 hypothetical protein BU25DRAFT_11563 [Macroventuria anomochaeta]
MTITEREPAVESLGLRTNLDVPEHPEVHDVNPDPFGEPSSPLANDALWISSAHEPPRGSSLTWKAWRQSEEILCLGYAIWMLPLAVGSTASCSSRSFAFRTTAERQANAAPGTLAPIWHPSVPLFNKWRSAACDCLDILHSSISSRNAAKKKKKSHLRFCTATSLVLLSCRHFTISSDLRATSYAIPGVRHCPPASRM